MNKEEKPYIVADALLDTLKAHGISTIFGYPGGTILPFYDALTRHKDIKHVLVRHEQAAAFSAQGWARTTKQLGVCCATSGPGATNLVTGIADAMLDSIPILCITGQVPLEMIGKDMFQETDVTGVTLSITKHNYLVERPEDIVPITAEAIKIATSGRPGPVLIDLPKNIMAASHPEIFEIPKIELKHDPTKKAFHEESDQVIQEIINTLAGSKCPILLIGHGIKHANAEKLVNELIERTNIPTVSTILAKGIVPDSNPHYLGMLGMHGFYHANHAVHNADVIMAIGCRFSDRIVGRYDTFAKLSKVIHVDIDPAELNKAVPAEIAVHSDAKIFLEKLLSQPDLDKINIKDWTAQIDEWKRNYPYELKTKKFTVRNCLLKIMEETAKDPERYIIVADVGQHQMWTSLSCSVHSASHWLTSGGAGAMGFGLPSAIGAAFANPDKTVICVTGDGGLQMNIQEFATLKSYNVNVKVCIMNNCFLGMVRQWQELFYNNNYSAVEIINPDFAKVAEAYGLSADVVEKNTALKMAEVHAFAFNKKGPRVIEYRVEKEDNVFPMVPGGKHLGETITK